MSAWLSVSHHACRLYFYHFLQHYFSFSEGYKAFLCTRLPLPISNMTSRTSSPPYFAFESLCSIAVGVVEVKDMSSVLKFLDASPFICALSYYELGVNVEAFVLDTSTRLATCFCTSRCNLLVSLPRIARSKKFMKNFNFQTVTRVH